MKKLWQFICDLAFIVVFSLCDLVIVPLVWVVANIKDKIFGSQINR